jgi:formylglycine-generating enzyme required for sulfatase activity
LTLELRLKDPLGERRVWPHELPLTLGGEGAAIAVPGQPTGATAARIGVDERGAYIEPVEGGPAVHVNGRLLGERFPLEPGDVATLGDARIFYLPEGTPSDATLRVEHVVGNATAAPLVSEEERQAAREAEAAAQSIERTLFKPFTGSRTVHRRRSPVRSLVIAGSIVAVAFLWFLLTAVPVHVLSEPGDAEIDFAGAWPEISWGDNHLVRAGTYVIVGSKEGYETARLPFRVSSASEGSRASITLKKLPGVVLVDTQGRAGEVALDGKELGAVPGKYNMPAGAHEIVVRVPRYQEFTGTIDVTGGGEEQTFKPELVPGFSAVTVESKPAGAKVMLNGRELGVTPLKTDIDAGSYTLSLAAEGFKTWETSVQVTANTPLTIGPIELGLPDARLTVRSTPSDADVAVGGRYRGRTPLEIDLSPGMEHEIVLNRAGYEQARRRVPARAAERLALEVSLKPILGEVTVRGEPADAQLFIDGRPRGAARQTLSLPATQLSLEVRRDGFEPYVTTVTPQPGFPRVVEYKLLTSEQRRAAQFPPTIRTKFGTELKMMPVGAYQMGSPRREPGRRANESQRSVTFKRSFYIGVTELTNGEYRRFRPEHLSGVVKDHSLDQDNHPVVNVSWRDAAAYCNWLSEQEGLPAAYTPKGDDFVAVVPATTGYRLPTEAEWEWAARYEQGKATRRYPWGASLPIAPRSGNYGDASALELLDAALADYSDGFETTASVRSFPPNALGLYDMGGNVSEWAHDYYTVYLDLAAAAATDPYGPPQGRSRVVRGSSWRTTNIPELRLAYRSNGEGRAEHIGFRIARYVE